MKVLVVNCGSSSVKYTLFDMDKESKIAWGLIECIGLDKCFYKRESVNFPEKKETVRVTNHIQAVELIINELLDKNCGSISDIKEISVVGHRIVHGGEKFLQPVVVTEYAKECLKECFPLAPLHMPAHYDGITAVEKLLPGITSVLVFDTAFHQTIPDYAYMYALPYKFYEKDHIRKYGFHGTSHNYVACKAAEFLGKPLKNLKIITAHLGNGSSLAAIENGKVVDTSMGFTPLQGIVMGSRCGDIDAAIIAYLIDIYPEYKNSDALNNLLNKESGLLGISGVSADMRAILEAAASGSKKSELAFNMLCYSVKKYIGSFYAALNGIDLLVFTAGIGENSYPVREKVCQNLEALGIELDTEKNKENSQNIRCISKPNSKVKVLIIPTNEELMIARISKQLIGS
ncbi:MAG: acetate kinase [Elusimicrobiota bacterium]|jgi:acetate kinase|nr:acetate kinase [Elusimicrobiota bacterium]